MARGSNIHVTNISNACHFWLGVARGSNIHVTNAPEHCTPRRILSTMTDCSLAIPATRNSRAFGNWIPYTSTLRSSAACAWLQHTCYSWHHALGRKWKGHNRCWFTHRTPLHLTPEISRAAAETQSIFCAASRKKRCGCACGLLGAWGSKCSCSSGRHPAPSTGGRPCARSLEYFRCACEFCNVQYDHACTMHAKCSQHISLSRTLMQKRLPQL